MQWCARDRLAGDEAPARHVIARIEAIEAKPHSFEFLGTIGLERLLGLLALTQGARVPAPTAHRSVSRTSTPIYRVPYNEIQRVPFAINSSMARNSTCAPSTMSASLVSSET